MKTILLIIAMYFFTGCDYEGDTFINLTTINQEQPKDIIPAIVKFPIEFYGQYDPYHLPDASLSKITSDSITLDLTGFMDVYNFSASNSGFTMKGDTISIHHDNKTFFLFKTDDPGNQKDIKVSILEDGPEGILFELGWFIKEE